MNYPFWILHVHVCCLSWLRTSTPNTYMCFSTLYNVVYHLPIILLSVNPKLVKIKGKFTNMKTKSWCLSVGFLLKFLLCLLINIWFYSSMSSDRCLSVHSKIRKQPYYNYIISNILIYNYFFRTKGFCNSVPTYLLTNLIFNCVLSNTQLNFTKYHTFKIRNLNINI